MKHAAIYIRVSSKSQDTKSQEPDLVAWAKSQSLPVVWYKDKRSGKTMNRPGWQKLEGAIRCGRVATVICWRIDRLGRTVSGLSALFDLLRDRKVNLVSIRDGLDLSTPSGRLMGNVIASVAQYDNELRGERVRVGQALARKAGKRWGGSKAGVWKVATDVQIRTVRLMRARGECISDIALAVRLSRPTIYRILAAA